MNWSKDEFKAKFFLYFLNNSEIITVLGNKQKQKLISFGIPKTRIEIVPNACELEPVSENFVHEKQTDESITVLHLSLLIESKGFPEYLEAAEMIAKENPGRKIHFILCGPVSFTSFCKRFNSAEEKIKWIEDKIENINANSNNVTASWIRGARGEKKERLFRDAQIFVMPTTFPVEAQPLVLLEAMAAGCAIITSNVGEIETIMNFKNSILITEVNPKVLENEILKLIYDIIKRKEIALKSLEDVNGPLSLDHYANKWEKLVSKVSYKL